MPLHTTPEMSDTAPEAVRARTFLVVEDDTTYLRTLERTLAKRAFAVVTAESAVQGLGQARKELPDYALVDLRLPDHSGLELVGWLAELEAPPAIVVLTGYASIPSAVEAVKRGARQYLAKPATLDQILNAFAVSDPGPEAAASEPPPSLHRLEWEHIHRVLAECDQNLSETARRLGMHRRTLQRKLKKRPPPR